MSVFKAFTLSYKIKAALKCRFCFQHTTLRFFCLPSSKIFWLLVSLGSSSGALHSCHSAGHPRTPSSKVSLFHRSFEFSRWPSLVPCIFKSFTCDLPTALTYPALFPPEWGLLWLKMNSGWCYLCFVTPWPCYSLSSLRPPPNSLF